jgi:hypothetical protein
MGVFEQVIRLLGAIFLTKIVLLDLIELTEAVIPGIRRIIAALVELRQDARKRRRQRRSE